MKLKAIIITLLSIVIMTISAAAQAPQEVTLTVSSDGPTKEDATKNALRSAIEQAFGAFVSANTTILNDELIKDEIVTVSNGSIKEYKEISAIPTENGGQFVTLTATVSLPHLVTYAKSHGSECEFAGNTFGMEMKMFELQKQNELKALYNLTDQIVELCRSTMTFQLSVGEPKAADAIPFYGRENRYLKSDKNSDGFNAPAWATWILGYNKDKSTIGEIDQKALSHLQQFKEENRLQTANKYYIIPLTIDWTSNGGSIIPNYFNNTLSALTIQESETRPYRDKGLNLTQIRHGMYSRNSPEDIALWVSNLFNRIEQESNKFIIKDNTGQESSFFPQALVNRCHRPENKDSSSEKNLVQDRDNSPVMTERSIYGRGPNGFAIFGTGIFYNLFRMKSLDFGRRQPVIALDHYDKRIILPDIKDITTTKNENPYRWEIQAYIPKEDIGKYSKFWIEKTDEAK